MSGAMLLIDAGNSRLKWSLGDDGGSGVMAYDSPADIAQAPLWQRLKPGMQIWVASVARDEVREAIARGCAQTPPLSLHWVRSEVEREGLRNSYQEPARLGVDRWLAMLAIWQERRDAFIVVDAGSAITVDWVARDGRHLGGHIVPGLKLLIRALQSGTAQVKFEPRNWQAVTPGCSTDEAVFHGLLAMAVGYLEFALQKIRPLEAVPIYLTGGDAPLLQPHLNVATQWRPQLVLEGLQHLALAQAARGAS